MLTKLELENWRGIRKGVIDGFRRINVLVGRNNSGKSSVLDAILGLHPEATMKFLTNRRLRHGWSDLVFIGQPRATVKVWVNYYQEASYTVYFSGDIVRPEPSLEVKEFLQRGLNLLDSRSLYEPLLDDLYAQLLAQEQRLDKRWIRLVNEVYGLNVEYVTRTKFPTPNSPERLVVVLGEPENRAVAVEWLGDGVRLGMTILAAGLVMNWGLLLLEEPENHQHPSALFGLAKALVALAKETGNQIFVTTHNRECMQALLKAATEAEFVGELKFFHLQLLSDGTLWVRKLDAPDVQVLEDIGYDFRFDYEFASPRTAK